MDVDAAARDIAAAVRRAVVDMASGEGCAAQGKADGRADPFAVTHPPLNGCHPELVASIFLQVGIGEPLADGGARPVGFAAGHRIGAIIGGVEGAWAVVA